MYQAGRVNGKTLDIMSMILTEARCIKCIRCIKSTKYNRGYCWIISSKFQNVPKTERYVSIYKELLLSKGLFNKYIPNKRSRFGMKFFSLYGVSKYLWISFIYNMKEKDRTSSHRQLVYK